MTLLVNSRSLPRLMRLLRALVGDVPKTDEVIEVRTASAIPRLMRLLRVVLLDATQD